MLQCCVIVLRHTDVFFKYCLRAAPIFQRDWAVFMLGLHLSCLYFYTMFPAKYIVIQYFVFSWC